MHQELNYPNRVIGTELEMFHLKLAESVGARDIWLNPIPV